MGCFSLFPCFSSSKHKSVNPPSSYADQGYIKKNCETVLPTEQSTTLQTDQTPVSEPRDYSEDHVINDCNCYKTVGIDLEVENSKIISTEDAEKKENGKLGVLIQIENERKTGAHVEIEIENDSKIEIEPKEESQNLEVHVELENEEKTEVISDSSVSSYISYPPMHRYHNGVINEEEEEEDPVAIQDDSTESLFSVSINPRRQSKSFPVEVDDKEVNSPLKTTSSPKEIDCLLNPIENLAERKRDQAIPHIPILDLHQEKENLYLEQEHIPIPVSEDPSFKVLDLKGKVKDNNNTAVAVAVVTTSLSSWLVDSEKSITVTKEESQFSTGNSYSCSDGATSWKSFEDRPILGAWTIDEVKQISARSSPRKSPCRNPDETPIIGSVGSYWSNSARGTGSSSSCTSPLGMSAKSRRNRESKGLSCHSSPANRRLERALNKKSVV